MLGQLKTLGARFMLSIPRYLIILCISLVFLTSCDREDLTSGPNVPIPVPVFVPPPLGPGDVKMNEFVIHNGGSVLDEEGNTPPWLEIYNPHDQDIDLSGAFLSDSLFQPEKWSLPEGPESIIPALGYLIIYVDGKADTLGGLHANFELKESAGLFVLWDKGGISGDQFNLDTRGLGVDQAMGRIPYEDLESIGDFLLLESATPLAENSEESKDTDPGPTNEPFIRGDVNGSGNVSFEDSVLLNQILQGNRTQPACEDASDVDDDGDIDIDDFNLLTQAIFDASVQIAPPFPNPGQDPTADGLNCPL